MRCPSCLTLNLVTNRFCGQCGTRLDAVHTGAPAPVAARGEVKMATVLFADVVSSTEHVAGLDAEQAMEQLRPAVQQMCAMVERYGGTVLRTLGDGIMVLFGVPRALEGHARLACEAAQALQQVFTGNALGLAIRVGLHSGPVALDPADAAAQMGGGVHGVAIHIASRVVALAAPGGICLTRDCLSLIGAGCHVRSLGPQQLKGLAVPVEVLVLEHLDTEADTHAFSRARLSRLRGREHELAALQDALQRAENGQAPVIGVVGAPGTGKSRLCHEFVNTCRSRLVPVHEVRSQLYGHATPLQPVLELLRGGLLGVLPGDSPAMARQRIGERLRVGGAPGPDDAALLQEFLGVLADDAPPAALQPRARRARLLQIVRQLVATVSSGTSVIVFEDLHWLDEASAEFVHAMVEAAVGTRTLLVLNYRPAYRAPWQALPSVRQIELAALAPDDTTALVGELLRPRPDLQNAVPLIVQRCAGNPFFAEELVRSLLAYAAPAPTTGALPPRVEDIVLALPATVQAVIGARVDALGETEKTLLQICAVIGKEMLLPVLERVAASLGVHLGATLEALCTLELLQPQAAVAGLPTALAFRHPLIQEVAYTTQLKSRRAAVHAATAEAMVGQFDKVLDEHAALIAFHFEQANRNFEAAHHESRAARWIGDKNSAQAVRHWQKVRALLSSTSMRFNEADRLHVFACAKIAWLGWREGLPLTEVLPIIYEAKEIADAGDRQVIRLLLLLEGRMLQANGGSMDRYIALIHEAFALLEPDADIGEKVLLNAGLCQANSWAGRLPVALAASDAALAGIPRLDRFEEDFIGYKLEHWVLVMRGRLLVRLGDCAQAEVCLQRVAMLNPENVDPVLYQIAHYGLAEVACVGNDLDVARRCSAVVAAVAEETNNAYLRVFALACEALVAASAADHRSAIALMHRALEMLQRENVAKEFETELLVNLAESHLASHDAATAYQVAVNAIQLSTQRHNRLAHLRGLFVAESALLMLHGKAREDEIHSLHKEIERLLNETGLNRECLAVHGVDRAMQGQKPPS